MPPKVLLRRACALAVCLVLLTGSAGLGASSDPTIRFHLPEPVASTASVVVTVVAADDSAASRQFTLNAQRPVHSQILTASGDYDITVRLADGRAATTRVSLRVSHLVVCLVGMPADRTSAPTMTWVDDVPVGQSAGFDARALRDLPSAGNLWSLVETAAPFVVVDRLDTGGLGTGRTALVSSRGESWALTRVSFGGLPVQSPTRTGALPVMADMNAASAVTVSSGLAPIDVDTPGVVVDWTPRTPGQDWSGGLDASVTTPGMVGTNRLPLAPSAGRIDNWRQAAAFAGGPVASHAGLFVSTGFTRAAFLDRDVVPLLTAETRSVLAHLVSNPTASDQVRVLAAFESADRPFDDRQQFAAPDVNERATFGRGQVGWNHISDGDRLASLSVGYQRGRWQPDVDANVLGGTIDRVLHGVVPPPAADETRMHWDARADWTTGLRRFWGMAYDGRLGVTLRRSSSLRDIVALPVVAESVAGLPARVWVPGVPGSASSRAVTTVGLFASDRFVIGPRFTLEVGARADMLRGSNGGATDIRWTTFSPRVSFRWSPAAVSFFGGGGRYASGDPLSFLAFGDPGEVTWDVYRWTDPNLDGRYAPDELGGLVKRAGTGPSVASIDPDLRVPRTTEWVAGMEVRPTRYSTLRGSIVIRRQTNLVGVVNTGLTSSDYRVSYLPDAYADEGSQADDRLLPVFEQLPASFGRDALLLTNPDAEPVRHDGVEVTYEISSPRWFMLFGATAYRTLGLGGTIGYGPLENDPLVLGDRYANPNATKDEAGRLFFDRAYVGKWTTAYRAPGDIRLAAVVRYQDGQPFTRYVVVTDLAGGPETTQAYPMGRTRFTYTATVDARIEKGVSLGGRRRVSVRLDAFNLTNHRNELEENVLTGPDFRVSTVVQPPRTLRVGVRVEF